MINEGIMLPIKHLTLAISFIGFFWYTLFQLRKITRYWAVIYIILSAFVGYTMSHCVPWGTDEIEYTATFYATILSGQNPYTTPAPVSCIYEGIYWSYLPLLGFIQIPYLGPLPVQPWYFYQFTNLLFVLLIAYTLREKNTILCMFFNPVTINIIIYGYNDLVPVFFLFLGILHNNKIAAYIGCATKQFNLPIMTLVWIYKREYKTILKAFLFVLIISTPFILWDYEAFSEQVFLAHIRKAGDFQEGAGIYPNYLLYPIALISIYHSRFKSLFQKITIKKTI